MNAVSVLLLFVLVAMGFFCFRMMRRCSIACGCLKRMGVEPRSASSGRVEALRPPAPHGGDTQDRRGRDCRASGFGSKEQGVYVRL
jgi:hypothetical protein